MKSKIILIILIVLYSVSAYLTKLNPIFFGYTCAIFLLIIVILALKIFRHKF